MRASTHQRLHYCTFVAPAIVKASVNQARSDALPFCPLSDAKRTVAKSDISRRAFVVGLQGAFSPANVAGFVMAIVVNAVQRIRRARSSPYRGQKFFKILEAKFNATAAIISPLRAIRICAADLCLNVNFIFRAFAPCARFVVPSRRVARMVQASARFDAAAQQIVCSDNRRIAAFTLTQPVGPLAFQPAAGIAKHVQFMKFAARQIAELWIGRKWFKHRQYYST